MSSKKLNQLSQLEKLFQKHISMPFPEPIANDELYVIKGELALYGGHVVGLVSSYLQNAPVNSEFIKLDQNLKKRMKNFIPKTQEEKEGIVELIDYRENLDKLITTLSNLINK